MRLVRSVSRVSSHSTVMVGAGLLLVAGLAGCSTRGSALDDTVMRIGSYRYTRADLERDLKQELGKDAAAKAKGTYDAAVVAKVLNDKAAQKLPAPTLAPLPSLDGAPVAQTVTDVIDRQLRSEYNTEISALFAKALKERSLEPVALTPEIEQSSQGNVDPAQWAALSQTDKDQIIFVNRQIKGLIDGSAKAEGTPEAYFKAHPDEFPAQVCASHILVKTKAEAVAARARIVGGEPFTKVASISIDPGSGAKGGDLGCADPSGYVPEFAAATKTLPLNELSQPVQTQFGFHLIQVRERKSPALADVLPQIEQKLQQAAGTKLQTALGPAIDKIDQKFTAQQQAAQKDPKRIAAATAIVEEGRAGFTKKQAEYVKKADEYTKKQAEFAARQGELTKARSAKIQVDARYGRVGADGAIVGANTPDTSNTPRGVSDPVVSLPPQG